MRWHRERVMVMLIGFLTIAARTLSSLRAPLLVVAVSALFALLFTLATRPVSPGPVSAIASEAQIRLMQDEHALVADYVRTNVAAERAAGLAADRDRTEMRSHAIAEAAEHAAMVAAPVAKAAPKVARAQVAQVPLPQAPAASGPPLQLQATMTAPPRRAPVAEGARAVIATVGRIPHWVSVGVQEAANWVIVAPVQTIARLPERRFL
jgi:hypothetical protein